MKRRIIVLALIAAMLVTQIISTYAAEYSKTSIPSPTIIKVNIDSKYKVAWVPIKSSFTQMQAVIKENKVTTKEKKIAKEFVIQKGATQLVLTEGSAKAYINKQEVKLEKEVMKDGAGTLYVPVSFVIKGAKELGYRAVFNQSARQLQLREVASISPSQSVIILGKGDTRFINVEMLYTDGGKEYITSECIFEPVQNDNNIIMGKNPGEIIGANIGTAIISAKHNGKEVAKFTIDVRDALTKYYTYAYYEQVFESGFMLDPVNYTDRFDTVWNKDTDVEIKVMDKDFIDTKSALYFKNNSTGKAGISINLTKLLNTKPIKGKTSTIKVYARSITQESNIYVTVSIKAASSTSRKSNTITLQSRWQNVEIGKVVIPDDAYEYILNITTDSAREIKFDGLAIVAN